MTAACWPPATRACANGAPHPDDLRDHYAAHYADHPFVEVVEAPPGMRAVQRTNYAQVCPVVDPRGGRVTVFGVIDNLGKGAAGQALQNLNLMAGRPETEGLLRMRFPPVGRDDWLRAPDGLEPVAGGSVTTPPGFRAAGVACGLKASGALDLGILAADGPVASALVDTRSALPSAPVIRNRGLDRARLRAVVVNAGSANAATGSPGIDDADAMARRAAARLGLHSRRRWRSAAPGRSATASTCERVGPGIDAAAAALSPEGGRRLRPGHLHHRPGAQGRRVPPGAGGRRGRSSGRPPRAPG